MEYAETDDLVVVCGKGHERSIELDNQFFPWDDREVVKEEIVRLAKKREDPS
jgi:UDP-N-acetylmuramyl tripeptide synthase